MLPKIYITTTLPYVNADPHIGFALEIVQADIFARFKKMQGHEVFFNTGTDEHGVKIYRRAEEEGKETRQFVDEYAEKFRTLMTPLAISEDVHFIRTTDPYHEEAAQEFWRRCFKAGDIYKKNYRVKYCIGCELEKTDSELVDGRCPIHPHLEIELLDEENYFFRLSRFREPLLALYESRPDFVVPDFRFNEIRTFVERGWEDFSISRLKRKMPWGVAVPDDPDHVMYVWFDAFVNYISAIGWPHDLPRFEKWWPVIQFAGKDQVRQQAAMWQAMLMSAGLPPSRQILIHGFITSGGQKMSKSIGNVVNPLTLVDEYGTDALRYYLAREVHPFEDSDYTAEKFREAYNANLANGLGNLVSRVLTMAGNNAVSVPDALLAAPLSGRSEYARYEEFLEGYTFNRAADVVWELVQRTDKRIQERQPFKMVKTDPEAGRKEIEFLLGELSAIGRFLAPFLPGTSRKILALLQNPRQPEPLFLRK
ncbi:MAG: methionine--tRNA ligase [bacterium]|nr:methionine--tRNA ligase [bacterium]